MRRALFNTVLCGFKHAQCSKEFVKIVLEQDAGPRAAVTDLVPTYLPYLETCDLFFISDKDKLRDIRFISLEAGANVFRWAIEDVPEEELAHSFLRLYQ
ncbi:hypothetical protein EVAR_24129_1 [Eumeta japonica]|uniref:Uncharacterized protein n=1 Tax=Eumeta variegata TaxID=151549 RepID=A0A4C1YR62_EUMVA|nr:hypothetical protein EVAR_24129_1 [Eumeta japonica]